MTSCFQKNGFGSNGIDSLGCWHVEPHWRLVHISDVDQTVVLASPPLITNDWKLVIFSSRSSGNRCDIFVFWRSTSLFRFMNRVHHPLETRKLSIFICCAVFFGVQTDQISCHGKPTLSVFLDPFDDLFLELRPLALPATICTFGFRQRLYVVNLPSPVSD